MESAMVWASEAEGASQVSPYVFGIAGFAGLVILLIITTMINVDR